MKIYRLNYRKMDREFRDKVKKTIPFLHSINVISTPLRRVLWISAISSV